MLIYRPITTICSFVVTLLTTYRGGVAVICHYEIDSVSKSKRKLITSPIIIVIRYKYIENMCLYIYITLRIIKTDS